MTYWATTFLIFAVIAGVFGFGGFAVTAVGLAQILCGVFVVMFLITLVIILVRGRRG
ncbi:DUF1328 domain-containing protein [Actibacterium sp. 188UL27-1]|uniref:DUF1328 domain-containing protein n=1 Tax=Actibacterium sp. 188UL27-1 TaxID=2786961 RepID=UPI00195B8523|nr:DUF1328 domain-containing protein [Actibacterium sp. 188UL27-1]MBM7069928.1 DUF1328 domain-containing protein [Actibacterium sp. 188UL27-1]